MHMNMTNKDGFILLAKENDCFGRLPYGSNISLKNASPDKVYMQRLARCKTYAKACDIYLGIKNPVKDDLKSLYDLGCVARFTKPQFLKTKDWCGMKFTYATRIWWKATPKGLKLLKKLGM